jgi:hypothetical protein
MNILLVVTVIWLSGNTTTEEIGLFSTDQDCNLVGAMVANEIFETNGASGVSFTCSKTTEG